MRRIICILLLLSTLLLISLTVVTQSAQAQTFKVIYSFTGGEDGSLPRTGLTLDAAGNLYGATSQGGAGYGTVFKLGNPGTGWVLNTLYSFRGGNDGATPLGRVTLASDQTLYGTTNQGGFCGTVFRLAPSATARKSASGSWDEIVIYRFRCGSDGGNPQGDLAFDQLGNIYGTTWNEGGGSGNGTVYELVASRIGWTETTLFSSSEGDGEYAMGGVAFDRSGSLYGVFQSDYAFGEGYGVVYQLLRPGVRSWKEQTLHAFTGGSDGGHPVGGLITDSSGNLYGTTSSGGSSGGGTVFEFTPTNSGWTFNTLYNFSGDGGTGGPHDKLLMDAAGNLYGTTLWYGTYGFGSVFMLTPSNGGWTYTSLHDFTNGNDGGQPFSNVVFDANGTLYGTAFSGGGYGYGVVWEITP